VKTNPFRVGEHVRGTFFTDRAEEVRVVLRAMRERGRLLVWGPRRMGKSTLIGVAAERLRRDGGIVVGVDLATITSLTDAADRLLAGVSRQAEWHDRLLAWVKSLGPTVVLTADPQGRPQLSVGLEARPRRIESERVLLERVLDQIEATAAAQKLPVVVILDEFQRLAELDGESAEWLVRNRMQEHRSTAYVCAGSKESLVSELLQPQRAFFQFFELLHVGAMGREHLARWIDHRFESTGIEASGVGAAIVEATGSRTQDIILTARTLWFRAALGGRALPADVPAAIGEIVMGEDAALLRTWEQLSAVQQKVLKAVAAGTRHLHSAETREQFQLGPSSSVTAALEALVDRSILARENGEAVFESPFFRLWVERAVLKRLP
jgi:AAA+ ATPase superfamily predicted ATPase